MIMVTLRVKENSKQAKAFLELVKTFDFVNFVDTGLNKSTPTNKVVETSYNPEFVAKILKAKNQIKKGKTIVINTNDIWGSLGLK